MGSFVLNGLFFSLVGLPLVLLKNVPGFKGLRIRFLGIINCRCPPRSIGYTVLIGKVESENDG